MVDRRRSSVVEVQREKDDILRVNDNAIRRLSQANQQIGTEINEARAATDQEHDMRVRDSLKLYKTGIAFSLLFSLAVVMEGYDLSLMGSFMEFSPFRNRYGDVDSPDEAGERLISPPWQSGIQNGVQVGSIIGLYINGWVSDKFGYKKTMIGAMAFMIAFIFIPFFAQNIETILVGGILQGIPWGVFQTLTVTYASEVTPTNLRAYLTTYVNLCWVMGQLIAAGVLRGFLTLDSQWAYRVPFAIQWIWTVPIIIGAIFAPESPWWLVRKGRLDEARASLLKITSRESNIPYDVDAHVSMIKATNELEKAMSSGTSYLDCFRGIDLRRTEIASMAWITQAFCGAALMGYSTQFYRRAGLPEDQAFNFNLGQYGMGFIGTVGSWFLLRRVGRRTLYIHGLTLMLILLLIVGGLGTLESETNPSASWAIGSLLLVYTFIYDITVGPVCYTLVSEIPSTRLKTKTVVLARNFYNIGGIINNILMPRMLSPVGWNWQARTGFFWAGACLLLLLWTYFRLPEPKDRTYGELDVLFENKVSARKFATVRVDQFSGHHTDIVVEDDHSSSGRSDGGASSVDRDVKKENTLQTPTTATTNTTTTTTTLQ